MSAQDPLETVLASLDLSCTQFTDPTELSNCQVLNRQINNYRADTQRLQQVSGNAFSNVMEMNQFRDSNWLNNYKTQTKKDQINALQQNLNNLVSSYVKENEREGQVIDRYAAALKDYEEADRYISDENRLIDKRVTLNRLIEGFEPVMRDRLITFNYDDVRAKDKMIHHLRVFLLVLLLMTPLFVGYLMGSISFGGLVGTILFITVVYLIYLIYEYGFRGESRLLKELDADARRLNKQFQKFGDNVGNTYSNFAKQTCSFSPSGVGTWSGGNNLGYVPVTKGLD